jgi:hypothetical protein
VSQVIASAVVERANHTTRRLLGEPVIDVIDQQGRRFGFHAVVILSRDASPFADLAMRQAISGKRTYTRNGKSHIGLHQQAGFGVNDKVRFGTSAALKFLSQFDQGFSEFHCVFSFERVYRKAEIAYRMAKL